MAALGRAGPARGPQTGGGLRRRPQGAPGDFGTLNEPGPGKGLEYPKDVLVSGPVDYTKTIESLEPAVEGQVIIVTGGASGIGEACCRKLALLGAHVAIGDIDQKRGQEVADSIEREIQEEEGNGSVRFFHCNVVSYDSQSQMFLDVLKWAPAGEGVVNCVIANAGVSEVGQFLVSDDDAIDPRQAPPAPNLTTFHVNYVGVLNTVRLAHHFLRHSPYGDRHVLIMGSYASILHSPSATLYSSSKHGLVGLFASLRLTSPPHDRVRFNIVCPYFVTTPIMPGVVKFLLVGQPVVPMAQAVNCIVRLVADESIAGRLVAVGPDMEDDVDVGGGLTEIETFSRRAVKALNIKYHGPIFLAKWWRVLKDGLIFAFSLFWVGVILKWRGGNADK